jgi:hypothetical protein
MVFYAIFPKVLAVVAMIKVEFDRVLVETEVFRMQFHQELLSLKAQLAYFGPRERVYFGIILKD